jgi:hypothetical protein
MTLAVASTSAPCTDVLDRTVACPAPDDEPAVTAPDAKATEPSQADAPPDVTTLPAELLVVSAGLAFGGAAALVLGLATTATNDDELLAQEVATYVGAGMLAWSSLIGAGALALSLFDPATGAPQLRVFQGQE